MNKAKDAIPLDSVSLSDAFDLILERAYEEESFRLRIDDADWLEHLEFECEAAVDAADHQTREIWAKEDEADVFLRLQLRRRLLVACVLHPRTGLILQLGNNGWLPKLDLAFLLTPFRDDYIDPAEGAFGPEGSVIMEKARPIFFVKPAFTRWYQTAFPSAPSRGRPPGSGSFRLSDEGLIDKMQSLRAGEPSLSISAAALALADEALGHGTIESKAKRLERRYIRRLRSRRSL